ncbi:uncharacterized protein [Rutidosis leptorrhynchoides]|uniref:uncharacterized protein n=1 Tax=Rutidosis leptorrhynchoides TaxID=125765 RepID=UPI003A9A39BB
MGGLNTGSLKSKNLALLGKWWWRFKTETDSLWVKVIRSIHGYCGGLMLNDDSHCLSSSGVWRNIICAGSDIEAYNVPFKNSFLKTIGDGGSTRFWLDHWLGEDKLCNLFPRLFRLELYPDLLLSSEIDANLLCGGISSQCTERNNHVPQKLEIFAWRALKKRLSVRVELDRRGVDLHSVRCPLCDDDLESVEHSLIFCSHALDVWDRVFKWCNVGQFSNFSLDEIFKGYSTASMSNSGKKVWQAIGWVCAFSIWRNRNKKVFQDKCWNGPLALSEIQVKSFEWINARSRNRRLDCILGLLHQTLILYS